MSNIHSKNSTQVFFLGCFIGSILFLLTYGLSVLSFTNTTWLMASDQLEGIYDLTQHYLGWEYFRNSSWHFPLGLLDGLYSTPISVTYTDSIPLFALFFKLFSALLPKHFQYFGLFGILSYSLTGGFGALLLWQLKATLPYSIISSIFFVLSPVLTKRMFYHTALAAPFLILAAFCLCVARKNLKRNIWILLWCILSTTAVLINPYYVPMVLGTLLCELFYELLNKSSFSVLLLSFLFPVLSFLFFGYLTGMFYGSVDPSANGLENLSFNLAQFLNPVNEQLQIIHRNYLWAVQNYSKFLPVLPLRSPWQVEGFSYLGAGMILLFLILFILYFCKIIYKIKLYYTNQFNSRLVDIKSSCKLDTNIPLFLAITVFTVVFTFLALSPTATFLNHTLYQISYPAPIYNLLSIFRSTGRLIWPVYYGSMVFVFVGIHHLLAPINKRIPCIVLSLCLLLQIVDLSPALINKHKIYTNKAATVTYESPLTSKAWDILGHSCKNIIFYPPTHYGLYCDPYVSCTFVEYALRYKLTCNISYLSRNLSAQADATTYAHFARRKTGDTFPENIYVFFDISEIPPASETGLNYYKINGYIIGTELNLSSYSKSHGSEPDKCLPITDDKFK